MKYIPYEKQLRKPRWIMLCKRLKEKAGWKCTKCGETKKLLHVHHLKYINGHKVWEYPDELLVVLCCDCHDEIHRHERLEKANSSRSLDYLPSETHPAWYQCPSPNK
jgi:5-methylcytosine-specific restriction endonuclease McrA